MFCVYTVLIGDYEQLNEFEIPNRENYPLICLTDNPHLKSKMWEVRLVEPLLPMDPIRSQRALKVLPHIFLPEFDGSLYIDNTVKLTADIQDIRDAFASPSGMTVMSHSYREIVMDEFLEVAKIGYDDNYRIFEQLNHYLLSDEKGLSERPFWNGILLRDHRDETVRRTMDIWWAHICRYSRRDQLSFNYVLRMSGLRPRIVDADNHESWLHTWPHPTARKQFDGTRNATISHRPVAAQLRVLEQEKRGLQEHVERDSAQINELLVERASISERVGVLENEAVAFQNDVAAFQHQVAILQNEVAVLQNEKERVLADSQGMAQELARQAARISAVEPGRVVVDGGAYVREGSVAAALSRRLSRMAGRHLRLARFVRRGMRLTWWTVSFQLHSRLREWRRASW